MENRKIDGCFICKETNCPQSGYFMYVEDMFLCMLHGHVGRCDKRVKKKGVN